MPETKSEESTRPLRGIIQGTGFFAVGQIISKGTGFLFNWLLTTGLGVSVFGVYVYVSMLISAFGIFSDFGAKRAIVRFLPEYDNDPKQQGEYLFLACLMSIVGGFLTGGLIWIFAPLINNITLRDPSLVTVSRILAISLPFTGLINVLAHTFQGLEEVQYKILLKLVTHPLFRVILVAIAVTLTGSLLGVASAIVIASVFGATAGFVLLLTRTRLSPILGGSKKEIKSFLNFSIPLSLSNVENLAYSIVDVFMLGLFLTSTDVGIYKIAVLLASLLSLPLTGVGQFFAPIAARLHTSGEKSTLDTVYKTTTRWVFSGVLLGSIGLAIFGGRLLDVFGSEFIEGKWVLVVLVGGYLANSAVGPVNWLLTMADRQYLVLANHLLISILNIFLNFIFIQKFGLIGAAFATASSMILLNLVRLAEAWTLDGYQPFTRNYVKPMVAALPASAVMLLTGNHLSGILGLTVGGSFGTVVYIGSLYLLGIEQQDKQVWTKILKTRSIESRDR
jgi:O-antigen/teichoic acid export membrane protein